ncbi:MAG: ferritin-like domain-containing protein [Actinomycetota bacterium]|nr:ferritin-like domain-containing protein [Actinomycetota bacterium]
MTDTNTPLSPDEVTKAMTHPNRRNFLIGTGGLAAAGLLAACGSDKKKAASTTTAKPGTTATTTGSTATTGTTAAPGGSTSAPPAGGAEGDLAIGAFAASLEVLAVNTYGAALKAAQAKKLGAVPPAVGTFVQTAMGHHQAHLDAWNKVLTGAGKPKVTKPPAALEAKVNTAFGQVKDVGGAAKLALMLEEIASDTYLAVIPKLKTKPAIELASSIFPIDRQHVAVLLFALGMYPVPETFATTKQSVAPA